MEIYNYIDSILVLVIAFVAVIYSVVITVAFFETRIKYRLLRNKTKRKK